MGNLSNTIEDLIGSAGTAALKNPLFPIEALDSILSLQGYASGNSDKLGPKQDTALAEWYFENLIKAEGYCSFMYLDHKGNITIGRGTLLLPLDKTKFPLNLTKYSDSAGANSPEGKTKALLALKVIQNELKKIEEDTTHREQFKFYTYNGTSIDSKEMVDGGISPKVASEEEILKGVAYLVDLSRKRQPSNLNYKASSYFDKNENNFYLTRNVINEIAKVMIQRKIRELKTVFPKFNSFPAGAQLALLDMAYTGNPMELRRTYPNFTKLIDEGNWAKIALELDPTNNKYYFNREGIQKERNDAVKILFTLAYEWWHNQQLTRGSK